MNITIKPVISISNVCRYWRGGIRSVFLLTFFALNSFAQNSPTPPQATPTPPPPLEKQFFKNILRDQKKIWTAPFRLRGEDAKWLIPLGAATTALIATDRRTSSEISRSGSLPALSHRVSQGGAFYTAGGITAGFYLIGRATNNPRAWETGLLAAEALIDSGIVAQSFKFVTQRPRPNNDGGRGRFFTGGNSFPSGHAAGIWSVATVIAYEYQDKPLVKYGVYGLATAVSISRYTGRTHFLSDVLIGSAIGYGIGRYVYKTHHDRSLDAKKLCDTTDSKLFPAIAPIYNPCARAYGLSLEWSF